MMKFILGVMLLLGSALTFANNESVELDVTTKSNTRLKKKKKRWQDKVAFSYGFQYLGPSLSSNYQGGATYNRFNSGQDFKNDDLDPTGSYQIYQSFALGYKINKAWKVTWSYTFQEELNEDIRYDTYNKDGSVFRSYIRPPGLSYNNQRINLFGNNLYSNNYFFVMSNFFYEMPTTEISRNTNFQYGLGVQPIIGIYSKIPNLYHGIKASIQRDYYKRHEFEDFNICPAGGCITKYRTLQTSLTAYIGYNITDKLLVQSDFIFDWDKQGDQIESGRFNEFNANMDDVVEIGPRYYPGNNMSYGATLQYSLNKLSAERSALLFNYSLYL